MYLKNSASTVLTAGSNWNTMISNASLVYSATINSSNMPTATGYWMWNISPFNYTGDAIEAYIEWTPIGTLSSPFTSNSFTWEYTTTSGTQAMGTSNNSTIASNFNTWTTLSRSYNTQIGYSTTPCTGTPSAFTLISSAASVCPNSIFELSVQNPPTGTGISYQWQSKPIGSGTYTNIANTLPTSVYTVTAVDGITVPAEYTVVAICANSGQSAGSSNSVAITMNSFTNCYCSTGLTSSGAFGDIITNVTMGPLIQSSGGATPWYTAYNNTPVDLIQGTSQSISISFGTDGVQHSAIWIDFDGNGTFEASENLALSTVAAAG